MPRIRLAALIFRGNDPLQRRRAYFLYAIVGLLVLQFAVALLITSSANYPENFDEYGPGVSNPGSWTFSTYKPSCFMGETSNSNNPPAQSLPNSYYISMQNQSSACTPGTLSQYEGSITSYFNATGYSTFVSINFTTNFSFSPGVVLYIIRLNSSVAGGTVQYAISSTNKSLSTAYNVYTSLNDSVPSEPGSRVNVTISLTLRTGSFGANFVTTALDNLEIIGANQIVNSATVNLLDSQSLLQFNIAAYPGSSFVITYATSTGCTGSFTQTASNQCTLNNLQTSYIVVSLVGATLLTVHVGGIYTRTLIPLSATHVNFLLDNASRVYPYIMTVTDLGQVYGSGSTITIYSGTSIITSGFLDQSASFSAPMIAGPYNYLLQQGSSQSTGNLSLGTSNFAISIQITKFEAISNSGPTSTISFGAYWNCSFNAIIGNYEDTSLYTSSVWIQLFNQTSSGTVLLYNSTFSGSIGSASASFAHINKTEGTYLVFFFPLLSTGRSVIGPVAITPTNPSCPGSSPSIIPQTPNFPISVFGLNQFTVNPNAWAYIIGVVMLILTASVFGARQSAIGYIVLSLSTAFFVFAIGLPLSYTLVYVFIITSMTSFLVYRRRKPF